MNNIITKPRLRIAKIPEWSWRRRLSTFFSAFVVIWVFLDPLYASIGGSGPLVFFGVWRYLILLIFAVFVTIGKEFYERIRFVSRTTFIPFEIVLTETGERYFVEAPQDMNVEKFINNFLSKISSKKHLTSSLVSMYEMYNNSLLLNRAGRDIIVSPHQTLKEAGIISGKECKITGIIKPEHMIRAYNTGNIIIVAMLLSRIYPEIVRFISDSLRSK